MSDESTPLNLTEYLAELEAEHARLDILIASIRQRLTLPLDAGSHPSTMFNPDFTKVVAYPPTVGGSNDIRADEFFQTPIPAAITKLLKIKKKPQTPKEIERGLLSGGLITSAKNFYTTMSTGLKRLKQKGEIVNTGNGWGLAEWYPAKPQNSDTEKKRKKRGAKRKKKVGGIKQRKPSAKSKKRSAYTQFLSEQMSAGKSMSEAAAAWHKKKEAG